MAGRFNRTDKPSSQTNKSFSDAVGTGKGVFIVIFEGQFHRRGAERGKGLWFSAPPRLGGSNPFPNFQPQSLTPKKTIPKQNYIAQNDDAFNAQLQTFKNGIGGYATLFGLTAAQLSAQAADSAYFDYALKCLDLMANGSQQWTAWKNLERGGGTPPASGAPVAPVFPTAVAAVAPGIEARFRALVQFIKANSNYNEAIGHHAQQIRQPQ